MRRGSHAPEPKLSRRSFLLTLLGLGAVGAGVAVDRILAGGPKHPAAIGTTAAPSSAARSTSPLPKASTPPPSPTPVVAKKALVMHAGGDTNLDPTYITTFRSEGFEFAWTGLDGIFERDDLSLVNCECPVSNLGSKWPGKEFNFRGDPAGLPAMRAAGIDVANLGNNHAYDYGPEALLDTRKNLMAHDIAPVGAGRNENVAIQPTIFERQGWTIAVVGFDKVVDPWPTAVAGPGHPGTAAGHDEDAMVAAVQAAKKDADMVLVAIHWGVELDLQPRADDVALGHRMIDAGADAIFGGHAHRLQPMEVYRGRPIFYSLGNFVWPNFSTAGSTTAVAEVKVSPKGKFTGRMIPAFITAHGHPVLRGT
jgi:poly-gamma-glutamate synthesis protein (capsule biosynthesis protein)